MSMNMNDVRECIINHYPYGIRINSPIELIRLKSFFTIDYNYDLNITQEDMNKYLRDNAIVFCDKAYFLNEELITCLKSLFDDCKLKGCYIIYYSCLYDKISNFNDIILSVEMLQSVLETEFSNFIYKKNYFLLSNAVTKEFDGLYMDVKRVWGDTILRSVSELARLLEYIPEQKIKYILSNSNDFVWNSSEVYALASKFIYDDNDSLYISEFAKTMCDRNGCFNFNDLNLESINEKNFEMSYSAIFTCIMETILVDYDRVDKVIRRKGECINQHDLIVDYCSHKKICSISELVKYQMSMTGTTRMNIIIDAASSIMIRINEEQFISLNAVSFKVYEIDEIISKFFKEKSIGIKEIISFAAFPECGVTWNYYVLESYLKHFSLMYKYCTNLSNSGNAGAIVRRNQNFDYFDILVDAVSKSKCNLEKDEIYSLLVEKGYLLKKYYKRIDFLIDVIKKGISS